MSTASIPEGSRPVARVIVHGPGDRVLLLEARSPRGRCFWVRPGGGLESGESFEEAAHRELLEETGLDLAIGPWVWTRRHIYLWNERRHDQYERIFVARTERDRIEPRATDSYVIGHRWWSLAELERAREDFTPRRLVELIAPILTGRYPDPPLDCGV